MGFFGDVYDWGKKQLFGGGATEGVSTKPQHYNASTRQLGQIARGAGQRSAPTAQAAQLGPAWQLQGGPQDQTRQSMLGVADQLNSRLGAIAGGQAPGAGELAINRQLGQATAAQQAAARMARGPGAALASRTAARNTMDLGLAGAGQAAQAQMEDQRGALAGLGQVAGIYGAARGQDIDVAGQNAQLGQQMALQQGAFDQQTAIANMQAQLAQTGMNDAQQIAALGQMLGWDQARIQAELQRAAIKAGDKGILPSLIQAGGTIAASAATKSASDARLKTDIADGRDAADEFMAELKPQTWRFRDEEKWGKGHRLGIMTQDLARSKMGRELLVKVDDKHDGFDIAKATGAALASVARLDERLRKLEGNG